MRTVRRLGPDLWLLVASVIAAAAVGRLFEGDLGGRVLGPLLVSAAVGSAVPAFLASVRAPLPVRAVAGTVAVILTSLWTAIGTATTFGLPTGHTWHVVQTDLRAARPLLSQFALPFPPAPGLVFLAAMACGVVALLASVLLRASDNRDRLYPGLALVCPLGLLAFACSQSTPGSMAFLVVLFVVAGALTLMAARPPDAADRRSDTGRGRRVSTAAALTACTMAGVLLAAVLVGPNAGGVGSAGPGVAPAVPLSAESLTSNLLSVEVHDANDVLFQATSRYRTYWQVAVLNVLRNGVWVPDAGTQAAAQGSTRSPAAPPSPTGTVSPGREDFTTAVRIQSLASRILPVPPGTVSVAGTPATLTGVGAVVPTPTTSGQQYTTVSAPPVTDPASLGGTASVAADPPALVQAETALPALPPSIGALARSITDGEQQPLAEAELLTNWFRSGRFHYTLQPAATPAGTDPLVDFLTQTRSGSCEQFAGAYVVLARVLGLPSRVVVGFTAGRYGGPGEVSVLGADAHAWPQVYLGARAGWVSFEPTPQQPRGEVAPEGVVGPTGVTRTGQAAPPTTAPSGTAPFSVPTTAPVPVGSGGAAPTTAAAGPGPGPGVVGWTLVGVAALLAVLAVLFLLRRRRRWSPEGRSPDELALLAQAEVERALRQAGVERPLWQPLDLLFGDLQPHDAAAGERTASLRADGMTVAATADAALFDPLGTSAERSRAAYAAALRVRKELKHAVASAAGVTEGA